MSPAERQANDIATALIKMNAGSDLEHMEHADVEALEALEHLAARNPEVKAALNKARAKSNAGKSPASQLSNFRAAIVAADISIRIDRKITKGTTSIQSGGNSVDLPAPLFGVLEYESNYTRVVQANLPQDGSVIFKGLAKTTDSQGLVFTYGDVGDAINETVTVRGEDTIYTNLLRAIGTSFFTIMLPKIILDDALQATQFNKAISYFFGSMFTKTTNDTINPNKYKTDYLSDNTVRILQIAIGIDPEHSLVPMILPTAQALNATVGYSVILPIQDFNKPSEYGTGFRKV